MNKKIAIILTLMITSTATLVGCGSTGNSNLSSSKENTPDTKFEVSSTENESNDTGVEGNSEKDDANKTESNTNNDSSKTSSNNNKTQTSSTNLNKTQDSNKSQNNNKTQNTTNSTSNKSTAKKAKTFTSKAGYALTFPASWEGKYIVEETSDSVNIKYKCSKDKTTGDALLFSIEKYEPNKKNYDAFESIGNKRFFNVGKTKYCIGGPSDIGLSEKSPDFKEYQSLKKQRADVINTIKATK